jgi:hypothetical protein
MHRGLSWLKSQTKALERDLVVLAEEGGETHKPALLPPLSRRSNQKISPSRSQCETIRATKVIKVTPALTKRNRM